MAQTNETGAANSSVLDSIRETTSASTVYFVDSSVADGALDLGLGEGSRVFVIENNSSAFQQMEDALSGLDDVGAVHVYSHGSEGAITLGGISYDAAGLESCKDILARIGQYLNEDADILLYACNTGAGSLGETFVQRMARLTQADVAASSDITGASGNWILETTVGAIETAPVQIGITGNLDDSATTGEDVTPGFGIIVGQTEGQALTGNVTNDRIYGIGGAHVMEGGDGNDSYYIRGTGTAGTQVIEHANNGSDTVWSQVDSFNLNAVSMSEVEHIVLQAQEGMVLQSAIGNAHGQTITGNALDNQLIGMGGNDSLAGGEGHDILDGGDGSLTGIYEYSTDPDTGAVTVGKANYNTTASDTLEGGKGDDEYIVRNKADVLVEKANEGTDQVYSFIDYTLGANLENLTLLDGADEATSAIRGEGNAASNVLKGNSHANWLSGLAGNDTLYGGKNGEQDTLDGGAGNDAYYVYGENDLILDSAGNDSLYSTADYDLDNGKAAAVENLFLLGDATKGTGNALNNRIVGNETQASLLDGGAGRDTLEGGTGNDTFVLDNTGDTVTDKGGRDTVQSSVTVNLNSFRDADIEVVELTGSGNINATAKTTAASTMYGNAGNNVLTGGNMADTLYDSDVDGNSGGADKLVGGKGDDVYHVSNTGTTVTEAVNAGTDLVVATGLDYTLGANLENLTLLSNKGDAVTLKGTGNSLSNVIDASAITGTAILQGEANTAGLAGDTLIGGTGVNIIYSHNANDSIRLNADARSNIIYVSYNVEPMLVGGEPVEAVNWGETEWREYFSQRNVDVSNATVFYRGTVVSNKAGITMDLSALTQENPDLNYLVGTNLGDTLKAQLNVASTLDGGVGADSMTGSAQGDVFYMDNVGDMVNGGGNDNPDTIIATANVDFTRTHREGSLTVANISGNIGTVSLGGTANLSVTGSNLNDKNYQGSATGLNIIGNAGNNTLVGTNANDTFMGGAGADNMTGGLGDDVYYVDNARDTVKEAANAGSDSIYTSGISINLGTAAFANAEYVENTSTAGISMTGAGNGTAVQARDESFVAGSGGDTVDGKGGADTIRAGAGSDRIWYYGTESITGTDAQDSLTVSRNYAGTDSLAASLVASFGAVELESVAANANLSNTAWLDIDASQARHGMSLTGNALANVITGSEQADSIDGRGGADVIDAGAGADSVTVAQVLNGRVLASYGNVDGGAGSDTLDFGTGADNLYFSTATDGSVQINAGNASGALLSGETGIRNFEAFTGGAGNDTLNAAAMTSGISLAGGLGNDSIVGGYGNDTITADGGNDNITTGSGSDVLVVTDAARGSTITVRDFNTAVDRLDDSTLSGWTRTVTQAGANATITWVNTANTKEKITFVLQNCVGAEVVFFKEITSSTGFSPEASLMETSLNIVASGSGHTYTGGNRSDIITSSGGNTLEGGSGNDSLAGTPTDTFYGGAGNDTISISGSAGTADGGDGYDLVRAIGDVNLGAGGLELSNVENLQADAAAGATGVSVTVAENPSAAMTITAGELADTLDGSNVTGNLTLAGGAGNDIFYLAPSASGTPAVDGGEGQDTLAVSAKYLHWSDGSLKVGDDSASLVDLTNATNVEFYQGADTGSVFTVQDHSSGTLNITGKAGADSFAVGRVAAGAVVGVQGGTGDDTLSFAWGSETGGAYNKGYGVYMSTSKPTEAKLIEYKNTSGSAGDTLGTVTLSNVSYLVGSAGRDTLVGDSTAANAVTLDGGAGNDNLSGSKAGDLLLGGLGNDTLNGKDGADTLQGGDGNDYLSGDAGNDSLLGGIGNDTLSGGAGNDFLDGGDGADSLTGGDGDDVMVFRGDDTSSSAFNGGNGLDFLVGEKIIWTEGGTATEQDVAAQNTALQEDLHSKLAYSGNEVSIFGVGAAELRTTDATALKETWGIALSDGNDSNVHSDTMTLDKTMWSKSVSADGYITFTHTEKDLALEARMTDVSAMYTDDSVYTLCVTRPAAYITFMGVKYDIDTSNGLVTLGDAGSLTFVYDTVNAVWTEDTEARAVEEAAIANLIEASGVPVDVTYTHMDGTTTVTLFENIMGTNTPPEANVLDEDSYRVSVTLTNMVDDGGPNLRFEVEGLPKTDENGDVISYSFDIYQYVQTGEYHETTGNPKQLTQPVGAFTQDEDGTLWYVVSRDKYYNATGTRGIFGGDYFQAALQSNPDGATEKYHMTASDPLFSGGKVFDVTLQFIPQGNDGTGGDDIIYIESVTEGEQTGGNYHGYEGDDMIVGNTGNDTMFGDAGNDILQGQLGEDIIYGGDGNDYGYGGNDDPHGTTVFGNAGDDNVSTQGVEGINTRTYVDGGDDRDRVQGSYGSDTLHGGAGDEDNLDSLASPMQGARALIMGNAGNDVLYGDEGNDWLHGDNSTDSSPATGNDLLFGDRGTYVGSVGDGNDTLMGGDGNDTLYGEGGNDMLFGDDTPSNSSKTGTDILYGGSGDDTLIGGPGRDMGHAGAGNDIIVYDGEDGAWKGGSGIDFLVSSVAGNADAMGAMLGVENGIEVAISGGKFASSKAGNGKPILFSMNTGDKLADYGILELADPDGDGNANSLTLDASFWTWTGTDDKGITTFTSSSGMTLQTSLAVTENLPETSEDPEAAGTAAGDTVSAVSYTLQGGLDAVVSDGQYSYTTQDDTIARELSITGSTAADSISALYAPGAVTILGNGGADSIVGSSLAANEVTVSGVAVGETVSVTGGAADDAFTLMNLGEGSHVFDGGSASPENGEESGADRDSLILHFDEVKYSDDPADYATIGLDKSGHDGVNVSLTDAKLTLTNMESVSVRGTAFNDTLDASALNTNGAALVLDGSLGDDSITGGSGNDFLTGGEGGDSLDAGAGNDVLVYDADDVTRLGGDGTDFLVSETASAKTLLDVLKTVGSDLEIALSGPGATGFRTADATVLQEEWGITLSDGGVVLDAGQWESRAEGDIATLVHTKHGVSLVTTQYFYKTEGQITLLSQAPGNLYVTYEGQQYNIDPASGLVSIPHLGTLSFVYSTETGQWTEDENARDLADQDEMAKFHTSETTWTPAYTLTQGDSTGDSVLLVEEGVVLTGSNSAPELAENVEVTLRLGKLVDGGDGSTILIPVEGLPLVDQDNDTLSYEFTTSADDAGLKGTLVQIDGQYYYQIDRTAYYNASGTRGTMGGGLISKLYAGTATHSFSFTATDSLGGSGEGTLNITFTADGSFSEDEENSKNRGLYKLDGGDDIFYQAADDTAAAGVLGSVGDDLIVTSRSEAVSTAAVNKLYGEAGNDILYGNTRADLIYGGDGGDFVYGGLNDASVNTLFGNAGTDNVAVQSSIGGYADGGDDVDRVAGGADNDTLHGGAGDENGENRLTDIGAGTATKSGIIGGKGNDVAFGDQGSDSVTGGEGNDLLYGDTGSLLEPSSDGNDTLVGGAGNDTLYGEGGNDILYGEEANSTVSGNDALYGGGGNDTLLGGLGADSLYGGSGNDIIFYDSEDSVIKGGAGMDMLVAADSSSATGMAAHLGLASGLEAALAPTGDTTLDVAGLTAEALAGYGINLGDVGLSGNANSLILSSAWVAGEADAEGVTTWTNTGQGLTLQTKMAATTGADGSTLQGGLNVSTLAPLFVYKPQEGDSDLEMSFTGSNAANKIDASAATGAVSIFGNGGADTLIGSSVAANDIVVFGGSAGAVSVTGGSANDVFSIEDFYAPTSSAKYTFNGGDGTDSLHIRLGEARLDDTAKSGNYYTTSVALEGKNVSLNSSYLVLENIEQAEVVGSALGDTINGSSFDMAKAVGLEDFSIHGGHGNDSLTSARGDMVLFGDEGNDTLITNTSALGEQTFHGGEGNDMLVASSTVAGNVTLHGDAGSDTYMINMRNSSKLEEISIVETGSEADIVNFYYADSLKAGVTAENRLEQMTFSLTENEDGTRTLSISGINGTDVSQPSFKFTADDFSGDIANIYSGTNYGSQLASKYEVAVGVDLESIVNTLNSMDATKQGGTTLTFSHDAGSNLYKAQAS